jgi:hypothetical protein
MVEVVEIAVESSLPKGRIVPLTVTSTFSEVSTSNIAGVYTFSANMKLSFAGLTGDSSLRKISIDDSASCFCFMQKV